MGVDVESAEYVVQVKAMTAPIGRPVVQQTFGVAMSRAKKALVFSLGGFTNEALEWATVAGVGLFEFDLQGQPVPLNHSASRIAASTVDSSGHSSRILVADAGEAFTWLSARAAGDGHSQAHVLVVGDGVFCQGVVSLLSDSTQLPVRVFRFDARIHDERELIARMSVVADGDQLVIHPIERLPQLSRDQLAKALEESLVDIVLGSGPTAQLITVELPRFSLIGVSEQPGLMSTELRGMFGYWLIQDA
jgi:hypothetical protein